MKNSCQSLIALLAAASTMASCSNLSDYENFRQSDVKNEYTKSWIYTFGLIAPDQDWCTVSAVRAEIEMPARAKSVDIYNGDPAEGGHLIGRASTARTVMVDMPSDADCLYARFADGSGRLVSRGYYPIADGRVRLDGSGVASRASVRSRSLSRATTYAHTPSYFDAMLICEDLGSIGDFDFNDIVLGLRHEGGDDPKLVIVPMAAGGTLASEIYFDGALVGETHNMIRPGTSSMTMLNTNVASIGSVAAMRYAEISLTDPKYKDWTIASGWGDITIKVISQDATIEINKPTEGTAPQLICLGGDWFWPREQTNIRKVYTGFSDWSCNAGEPTWLGGWRSDLVVRWDVPDPAPETDDRMWYRVTTSDGNPCYAHIDGSATATEIRSGQTYYIDAPWTSCQDLFAVYSTTQDFILNSEGDYVLGYRTLANQVTKVEFSPNFDLSSVTTFAHMFDGCRSLTSVNLADCQAPTTVLTDMTAMFHYCESLAGIDLSGWTVSAVDSYFDIFAYCTSLRSLNLDGWQIKEGANLRRFFGDTSGVTVKCPVSVETALTANDTVGGTSITYTRP